MKKTGTKDITERERYYIELYLKEGYKPKEIAIKMNRHYNTIYKEIKNGTVEMYNSQLEIIKVFCADTAHRIYRNNQREKGRPLKIGNDLKLIQYIENKIKYEKWSPDAIIGRMKREPKRFKTTLCTKTVYNYVDHGVFLNVTNKDLPVKREKKKQEYNEIQTVNTKNLKGTSIEDRPKYISDRMEFGHWELDTVVSGHKEDGKASLLVFTERKTLDELVFKMKNRTQKETLRILNQIERRYTSKGFRNIFKSITVDNGTEFLDWESMEKSIRNKMPRTKIYFCHPYHSWERPQNENQNKLIRRWIQKGEDIGKYSEEQIKEIEHWMNHYPRKKFNYLSAYEILQMENLSIAL